MIQELAKNLRNKKAKHKTSHNYTQARRGKGPPDSKQSPHRDISDGYESVLASSMTEEVHILERKECQKQGVDSYKTVHR